MKVRDIMTAEVMALGPNSSLAEVAQQMRQLNVGSIPVVQNGQLVGVITDRDIVVRVVADGLDPHLEQAALHMTRDPISVSPDTSVDAAARIMADQQIRRLPVVEQGKLVGYLALGDLALQDRDARIGDTLEQISEPAGQQGRVPERQNNV